MIGTRKHCSFSKHLFPLLILVSILLVACAPTSTSSSPVSPTAVSTQTSGCISSSTPSSKTQSLYVGTIKADTPPLRTSVYALDPQSGTTRWQTMLAQYGSDSQYQFLQVVHNVVYVAHAASTNYTDTVDALSVSGGRLFWRYQLQDRHEDIYTMVVCDDVIYLGISLYSTGTFATQSIVEALRAADGKLLWWHSNADSSYADQLEVTNSLLYLITAQEIDKKNHTVLSTIHALRTDDGNEAWHAAYKTHAISITATATSSVLYVILPTPQLNPASEIDALRTGDGALLWRSKTNVAAGIFRKAVANNLLYLDAYDRLCAFSTVDGNLRWCADSAQDVALQASAGIVYITAVQQVCALRADNGKKLWCAGYPNLGSTIIATDTVIYVASNYAGTLYALRESDGAKLWNNDLDHFVFALALEA